MTVYCSGSLDTGQTSYFSIPHLSVNFEDLSCNVMFGNSILS